MWLHFEGTLARFFNSYDSFDFDLPRGIPLAVMASPKG
jgi:hypothetical protein